MAERKQTRAQCLIAIASLVAAGDEGSATRLYLSRRDVSGNSFLRATKRGQLMRVKLAAGMTVADALRETAETRLLGE